MKVCDAETGKTEWVDTSSQKVRAAYKKWWQTLEMKQIQMFRKAGVDYATIRTDLDYVKPMKQLFNKR
jgi:hypothetical protein